MYCGVYNVCRYEIYDNNSTNSFRNRGGNTLKLYETSCTLITKTDKNIRAQYTSVSYQC